MQEIGAANYAVLERIRVNRREDHLKVFISSEVTVHTVHAHILFLWTKFLESLKKVNSRIIFEGGGITFFHTNVCHVALIFERHSNQLSLFLREFEYAHVSNQARQRWMFLRVSGQKFKC